jgi:hypothetical protein
MYIFAELEHFHLFMPDGSVLPTTFSQLFSTSRQATPVLVQQLLSQFSNGNRLVEIDGRRLGLLICGENNVIANRQSSDNEPYVRHVTGFWSRPYDILLNPAHTVMGNWGKLEKRFSFLSQQGRWVFYCTNNTQSYSWKSSLRVYHNGIRVRDGSAPTSAAKNWRSITIAL